MPSYTREELDQHLAETRAALKRESDVDMRNRLRREIDATHEALKERIAREEYLLSFADDPSHHDGESSSRRTVEAPRSEHRLRGAALTANERAERLPDAAREHMARTLDADADPEARLARFVVETANEHYFGAIAKWMRDPVSGGHEWTPEERDAVRRVRTLERAMSLTGANGGYLLPYELDPSVLISSASSVNPLREIARVETTAYNTKKFVTSVGVSAHFYSEAGEVSDDAPTLSQPSIDCRKAMAFVPVSFELFEDSDVTQQVGALFADAKAQLEATAFTTGDGVAPNPKGIITALVAAGGSTVIATGSNVLAQADLYASQAALPPRWRPNAKWMMPLPILNGFRQLPLATGLNYSIINDATKPPTALGWPIYENSAMDSTLTGSAADYLVLSGDFKQFAILDRVGATIETVPVLFGANQRPTGQRGFLLHWRVGSDVLIADAFRLSNYST
jgi:HK97 family phage major capsid protein